MRLDTPGSPMQVSFKGKNVGTARNVVMLNYDPRIIPYLNWPAILKPWRPPWKSLLGVTYREWDVLNQASDAMGGVTVMAGGLTMSTKPKVEVLVGHEYDLNGQGFECRGVCIDCERVWTCPLEEDDQEG